MQTIYKQQLELTDKQNITIPLDSRFLSVQIQHGSICIWYLLNKEQKETTDLTIHIYGTGHPIEEQVGTYLDTVQMGPLVWHVFYTRGHYAPNI